MSWNYRIMEDGKDNKWYSIREVFYNGKGQERAFTEIPIAPIGETPEELIDVLKMMLDNAEKTKSQILKSDIKCIGWE